MNEDDNDDIDETILRVVEMRQFIRRKDLLKLLLKEDEKPKSMIKRKKKKENKNKISSTPTHEKQSAEKTEKAQEKGVK